MASFQAFLKVSDKRYELSAARLEIQQAVDSLGRPASPTQGGTLLVELNAPGSDDPTLDNWMVSPTKRLSGKLIYKRIDTSATLKTITFYDAYCVGLRQSFDGTGQSGQFRMKLTISPRWVSVGGLILDNQWPDEETQSVPGDDELDTLSRLARNESSAPVSVIPPVVPPRPPICKDVAAATDMSKPKQARYDARMAVIQAAQEKQKADLLRPQVPPMVADATRVAGPNRINRETPVLDPMDALKTINRFELNNRAIERAKLSDDIYVWGKKESREKNLADLKEKLSKGEDDPAKLRSEIATVEKSLADLKNAVHPPEGWKVAEPFYKDPQTGFAYAVYVSEFEKPAKPVLVFRGTDNEDAAKIDWITNGVQGMGMQSIGQETDQYTQSMDKAQELKEKYNGQMEIAGHSKAGGQVAAASIVTDMKGYTFNTAGVHPNTVDRFAKKTRSEAMNLDVNGRPLVDAFNFPHDILSNLQDTVMPLLKAGLISAPNILVKFIGIGLAVNNSMPPAAGVRHQVPAQDSTGNPIDSPWDPRKRITYHGMPYLIDSMEKQKQDDLKAIAGFVGCS